MQMRKSLCSPSLAFDSAHVKYGVRPGPKLLEAMLIYERPKRLLMPHSPSDDKAKSNFLVSVSLLGPYAKHNGHGNEEVTKQKV